MRDLIFVLMVGVFGLAACSTTNYGLTYVSPVGEGQDYPSLVDNLQPTLKWTQYREPDVTYDVIIYEGFRVKRPLFSLEERQLASGKVVYYREGLKEPQHMIEEPLEPNAEYRWSVRARRGDRVTDWSMAIRNYPVFKTPGSK
jgi:hypothetical protein